MLGIIPFLSSRMEYVVESNTYGERYGWSDHRKRSSQQQQQQQQQQQLQATELDRAAVQPWLSMAVAKPQWT